MGRPFIFKGSSSDETSEERHSIGKKHRSELTQECVQSALDTLDSLQALADNCGLCRASYTEFSSCRAALLVILAESLNSGKSQKLQNGLDRGMVLIRQMIGGTASESEISYIESIEAAIRQLSSKEASPSDSHSESSSAITAYAKFKDWTQSMKKDKNIVNAVELSSFSPLSHFTLGADNSFHDLTGMLDHSWPPNDSELAPELFLDSST